MTIARHLPHVFAFAALLSACQSTPVVATPEPVAPVVAKPSEGMTIEAPKDVAAPPADALKTGTGLAYKVLRRGSGKVSPAAEDTVGVFYVGWTTDGAMFDKQIPPEPPINFPLRGVIAGWTEGLQLMHEGDQFRFWMPKELAYDDRPGAPAGMLVFDVELVAIQVAPSVPEDVGAPPADAKRTASGLAYKVLRPGRGGPRPTATSTVTAHYSGWTTSGKMFDSSYARGEPPMFPLNAVIPGWSEAVQLMDVGAKYRFWIPEHLAYKGAGDGTPEGMLVFDVELIAFE